MLNKLKELYYSNQEENIHAIKYALAFVIGYFVVQLLPPGKSQWVIITIAVVMGSQIVVGDHVLKSILRGLGTLIGAAIGVIAIYLPHNHIIVLALIVILAIFFSKLSSRYSDLSYVAILGMITFGMIALVLNPSWHLAAMRVIDILIGITIALLVSIFIFPLKSRRAFVLQSVRNFKNIAEFINKIYLEEFNRRYDPNLIRLESKIVNGVVKQRAIIKAMRFESVKKSNSQQNLSNIVRYSRAIYQYVVVIDVAMLSC